MKTSPITRFPAGVESALGGPPLPLPIGPAVTPVSDSRPPVPDLPPIGHPTFDPLPPEVADRRAAVAAARAHLAAAVRNLQDAVAALTPMLAALAPQAPLLLAAEAFDVPAAAAFLTAATALLASLQAPPPPNTATKVPRVTS